jgi:hypothetical protein
MNATVKNAGSLFKGVLIFLGHQLLGTFGVGALTYLASAYTFAEIFPERSIRPVQWILTETPFFPLQIVFGFYLGWDISRRLKHRSMLWVWIIPGWFLLYCLLAVPGLHIMAPPTLAAQIAQESQSPFSHYFGWGCRPKDRCIDQLIVTMPFYAAVAYSLGAWLGLRKRRESLEPPLPQLDTPQS